MKHRYYSTDKFPMYCSVCANILPSKKEYDLIGHRCL